MRWLRASVFAALVVLASCSYFVQLGQNNNDRLRKLTTDFTTARVEYCLVSEPKVSQASNFGSRYWAKVSAMHPLGASGLLIGDLKNASEGDCFIGNLRLSPGFEASRIFFVAKLDAKPRQLSSGDGSPIFRLRRAFIGDIRAVTPDSGALVAGLSIGADDALSPAMLNAFKVLSLTHLTAVSGTNCAIILGLVWWLLGRLRIGRFVVLRWPKLLFSALALFGYVLLVGPQPSVLRAGFMTIVVLSAKTLGRDSNAINALALSALMLLVIDPWMLFDYGFWLSFLACIGILVLAPKVAAWLTNRVGWMPKWLALAMAVSFSAQLLCFAVLLMLQPGFSTYSVLANLLAEPFVVPVTVLGLMAVVAAAFSAGLAGFLSWVASLFAWFITQIAETLTRLPASTGYWPNGAFGVLLALVLSACGVMWATLWSGSLASRVGEGRSLRRELRRDLRAYLRMVALLVAATVLVIVASQSLLGHLRSTVWAQRDWFVASCDVGQGDATVIRSQGKVALIDVGREPNAVHECLQQLGITRIDFLQLTHFDLDHVGGLSGALDGHRVGVAMVTPFLDTRPGADSARNELAARGVNIMYAETGLSGVLGAFEWQVLSPHARAPEAEDSNDGSITMLWRSDRVDIVTLADLGEKGQMRLAAESGEWMNAQLKSVPLIMKVSHHGSADQYAELIEALKPKIALISVGKGNSYGHPTARTLNLLNSVGSAIERTDERGSISVGLQDGAFRLGFQGEQGKTG